MQSDRVRNTDELRSVGNFASRRRSFEVGDEARICGKLCLRKNARTVDNWLTKTKGTAVLAVLVSGQAPNPAIRPIATTLMRDKLDTSQ